MTVRPPLSVVVADDHDDVRLLVRAFLEDDGRFVVVGEAGDGEEVLERVHDVEPSVVVLDLAMPRVNGLDALSALRRVAPATVVVVFSAHQSLREEAMRRGAAAFIDKGGSFLELGDAVLAAVGSGRN